MMRTDEPSGLSQPLRPQRDRSAYRNFLKMAVLFSINHGTVAAVLNISVQLLGDAGSYQSGALYITYALTALMFSSALNEALGPRWSLVVAAGLYSLYVLSLPLALMLPPEARGARVALALCGGTVGGFAAGFLWAAQGTYFALSARRHALQMDIEPAEANAELASAFASTFLSLELCLKALPIGLLPLSHKMVHVLGHDVSSSNLLIGALYSLLALSAAAGLTRVSDLSDAAKPEDAEAPRDTAAAAAAAAADDAAAAANRTTTVAVPSRFFSRIGAVCELWARRPVVLLLAPTQAAFGVSAALLGYEVTGKLVKQAFGADAVLAGSLCSALVSAVAALLQPVSRAAAKRVGRPAVLLAALLSFAALAALVLATSDGLAAPAFVTVLPFYLLQGAGRAGYEGINKALYADTFGPTDSPAAFSNIVLANGAASAVAYFTFPSLGRHAMAYAAGTCAAVAIVGYIAAEVAIQRTPGGRANPRVDPA
uniref:UNC93-like protein MFSD11 n=1 Tax=Emiliania huxleyi TaxID=2903 RepID=A0A7S3W718_EMIHU